MRTQIELLAPAGSVEALHAAVENGADAVYLGGKLFNARQQADNFDMAVMKEALEYAHARGVNIYLTLNTLVTDSEMKQALLFASEAGAAGIDGIIVQDIGLAAALHRIVPEIPLHASTQMTIYDLDGAKALEEAGFQRVVLARELTLDEASYIARNTTLEVEAFVHGALCVCYSGQCLMSSIIGGRSGNRGKCAQPCRLPYELLNDSGSGKKNPPAKPITGAGQRAKYLLSPKDICTLEHLGEIAVSGIHSLKIEGRMKSPEYVAVVVHIYRKYLDMALEQLQKGGEVRLEITDADMHDLLQIFNRGSFSAGYLKGKTGADMMCYDKPNNSGIFLGTVTAYDWRTQMTGIRLADRLSIGDGVEIWTGESASPGGIVSSIRKGRTDQKSAEQGESVEIGSFKGKIVPGCRVYKTTDAALLKSARESYNGKNLKRVGIYGNIVLKNGKPLSLRVWDSDGHSVISDGVALPEAAIAKPLTAERLKEQLGKTGSTPFVFNELQVEMEEGLSLPVSEINEVRRKALDELLKIRADKYLGQRSMEGVGERIDKVLSGRASGSQSLAESWKVNVQTPAATGTTGVTRPQQIALYFYNWDNNIDYSAFGAERLYFPMTAADKSGFSDAVQALRKSGSEAFIWLPSVTRGNTARLVERLTEKLPGAFDGILAGNIGNLHRLTNILQNKARANGGRSIKLAGDISMNVFNSLSVMEAFGLGLDSITLSAELTLQQIHSLSKSNAPVLEAAVYGRLPLMTSEYCPVGCVDGGFTASRKCIGCCGKSTYKLRDRMGAEFPVLCDRIDCRSTILNSNVLFLPDGMRSLKAAGIGIFRLYIWDEEPSVVRQLVRLYRASLAGDEEERAQYSCLADRIKAAGFTKGHYYRGV